MAYKHEPFVDSALAAEFEQLQLWRKLLLPLSAFCTFLFLAAIDSTGPGATTDLCFVLAALQTTWMALNESRIRLLRRQIVEELQR